MRVKGSKSQQKDSSADMSLRYQEFRTSGWKRFLIVNLFLMTVKALKNAATSLDHHGFRLSGQLCFLQKTSHYGIWMNYLKA